MRRADHSSIGVLLSVVCLTECDNEFSIMRRPWPTTAHYLPVCYTIICQQLYIRLYVSPDIINIV